MFSSEQNKKVGKSKTHFTDGGLFYKEGYKKIKRRSGIPNAISDRRSGWRGGLTLRLEFTATRRESWQKRAVGRK